MKLIHSGIDFKTISHFKIEEDACVNIHVGGYL